MPKQIYFSVIKQCETPDITQLRADVSAALDKLEALGPEGCSMANIQFKSGDATIDVNVSDIVEQPPQ